VNISELNFDKKNYNKGSEIGDKLLDKSIRKFGFRQPAVIDKNGNIVAGNKRIAKAGELGIEDVQIVKGDPNRITVVQYDDFDLVNDTKTKEYALADNQVASKSIVLDTELIIDDLGERISDEWLIQIDNVVVDDEPIDKSGEVVFRVYIDVDNEQEQNELWNKLSDLGFKPKIATL
jgi:hypothetical protein